MVGDARRRDAAGFQANPTTERIGFPARDDMNVKLRHHIADRRDIDLIAVRQFLERERHDSDFRRQRKGIAAEIGEFAMASARRGTRTSHG